MKRRDFIRQAVAASTVAAVVGSSEASRAKVTWEIGCFNRPWTKWSFDLTLAEIKAAGFGSVGLLSRTRDEPFISAEATPEYLDGLKRRIAASGLRVNMGALRSRHSIALAESTSEVRKQIDNAHYLGLKYVLSFGADKPEEFDHYFKVMSDAAGYADKKNIRLAMKPHGGISGSSTEILRVIEKVNHRNFSIWYDAGNIIYYTGKDPVAELEGVARHVTGFCAKDCGAPNGDVMIQFGTGKVNFTEVFRKLKAAGFNGPVMMEGCKVGEAPAETTSNARANREFLEKTLAGI